MTEAKNNTDGNPGSAIKNRLQKNWRTFRPWANKQNLDVWRLYHWDIPEYPFLVDVYKDHFRISDKSRPDFERDQEHLVELKQAIMELFSPPDENIHIVHRRPQTRSSKYGVQEDEDLTLEVSEGLLKFEVNLTRYVDTGLFMDHRNFRKWLMENSKGRQILNLFAYTGSLSVAAAKGGATVTHVDLSKTYIRWSQKNFALNGLDYTLHRFIEDNVLSFLRKSTPQKYDWIILDPPTFSNSKKMESDFDLQRDHVHLIFDCQKRLTPGGRVYFSGNKKGFKLDPSVAEAFEVTDMTQASIPKDFQGKKTQFFFQLDDRRTNV